MFLVHILAKEHFYTFYFYFFDFLISWIIFCLNLGSFSTYTEKFGLGQRPGSVFNTNSNRGFDFDFLYFWAISAQIWGTFWFILKN